MSRKLQVETCRSAAKYTMQRGAGAALTSFSGLSGQDRGVAEALLGGAGATGWINREGWSFAACSHWKGTDMKRTAKIIHFAALTAAAALYLATSTQAAAQSQRNCGPREAVVERLASAYGETRQSVGIGSNNAMVEVYASDETGSWTILVTMPAGVSCPVASGQSFEEVAEALPAKGNDA